MLTCGTYVDMLLKRALLMLLPFTLTIPETCPPVDRMHRQSSMELLPAPASEPMLAVAPPKLFEGHSCPCWSPHER